MGYETTDDNTLAQACRRGDTAAFECLVQRRQGMLLNIAFRMTGVYEDACDIVQDALLAAWRKIDSFRGDSEFATWLTAIVINLSRTRQRQTGRKQRREAYSLDDPPPGDDAGPGREFASSAPSVLSLLEERELRAALNGCIEALPPEFREVLVLRDMQELPYSELAAALGLREGTVKSRLFRARDTIKDCLKRAVGRT